MPIYEYACKKCGKTIEVIQKFSDGALRKHQGCGGALTKLISASGFQFKGTGWYVTDYAKKSGSATTEASSESAAKSESATKEAAAPAPAASKTPAENGKKSGGA